MPIFPGRTSKQIYINGRVYTTETPKKSRRGESITAADMNRVANSALQSIEGGGDVKIERLGKSVVVNSKRKQRGIGSPGKTTGVPVVSSLPPVPTSGMKTVIWEVEDDRELWVSFAGAERWYAALQYSTRSGVPVT